MAKLLTILGPCALAALWSCSFTGDAGSEIQSCYDTGHGIVCTTSSELGDDETDADGDGEDDELVCGDADSSDESMDGDHGTDDGETDDGETDDGETDDDGVTTATGDDGEDDGEDEESDAEGEESTSDSDSEDCASSDGDDDNDGLDDGTDCDCGGDGDEPPTPPEDPCTDCTPPE